MHSPTFAKGVKHQQRTKMLQQASAKKVLQQLLCFRSDTFVFHIWYSYLSSLWGLAGCGQRIRAAVITPDFCLLTTLTESWIIIIISGLQLLTQISPLSDFVCWRHMFRESQIIISPEVHQYPQIILTCDLWTFLAYQQMNDRPQYLINFISINIPLKDSRSYWLMVS